MEVTVVAHAGGDGEMPELPTHPALRVVRIRASRWRSLTRTGLRGLRGDSLRIAYGDAPELRDAVAREYASWRPHVVYVERLRGFPATRRVAPGEVVFDPTDSLPLFYRQVRAAKQVPIRHRLIAMIEQSRLAAFEHRVLPGVGAVIACTSRDAAWLTKTSGRAEIDVVANGVDLGEFYPGSQPGPIDCIVMTGNLRTLPNREAAEWLLSAWPDIRRQLGSEAALTFAGGNPSARLRAAHGVEGVEVTGFVETLRDAYWHSGIAVVAVRLAVGTQNKLIEPLACGTLVVATPEAAAGLPEEGRAAIVVAERTEIAAAIAALRADPPRQALLRQRGLDFVRSSLDWDILAEQTAGILRRTAAAAGTLDR